MKSTRWVVATYYFAIDSDIPSATEPEQTWDDFLKQVKIITNKLPGSIDWRVVAEEHS